MGNIDWMHCLLNCKIKVRYNNSDIKGEHTMINEKYVYEDFEKMVKLAALEDYKYSYNEMQGAHQFTNGNNDECIEVNDYSTADGKPDNWDGDVHSDWNKICMELAEEFSGIVPGIHKKYEVWHLSDTENNGFAEEWLILSTNDKEKAIEEARSMQTKIKGKEGVAIRTDIDDSSVVFDGIGSYEYNEVEF